MTALNTEFEQKFTKVLRSRVTAVPRGVMGALDPHPNRRPEQDGRSPPCRHRRDLSPGTERLPRRPGGLRQQLEPHHSAHPSPGTTASAHSENGPSQPLADTVRRGEDHVPAIVRGSYRSVYHRCSHGGPGVDPGSLGDSAGNTARLAPLPARPGKLRTGAIARSTDRSIPVPALCRPPTSQWRAGARVDVGRPHQRLDQPSRGELSDAWPRPATHVVWCRPVPQLPPLSAPQQGNPS